MDLWTRVAEMERGPVIVGAMLALGIAGVIAGGAAVIAFFALDLARGVSPDGGLQARGVVMTGRWTFFGILLLATVIAQRMVARRVDHRPRDHALAVALLAAVTQFVIRLPGGVSLSNVITLLLVAGAGWLVARRQPRHGPRDFVGHLRK